MEYNIEEVGYEIYKEGAKYLEVEGKKLGINQQQIICLRKNCSKERGYQRAVTRIYSRIKRRRPR